MALAWGTYLETLTFIGGSLRLLLMDSKFRTLTVRRRGDWHWQRSRGVGGVASPCSWPPQPLGGEGPAPAKSTATVGSPSETAGGHRLIPSWKGSEIGGCVFFEIEISEGPSCAGSRLLDIEIVATGEEWQLRRRASGVTGEGGLISFFFTCGPLAKHILERSLQHGKGVGKLIGVKLRFCKETAVSTSEYRM